MQALRVPARRGIAWITEGYGLFARNPLVIIMLVFAYLFVLGASAALHFLGNCIMAALLPSFSVGLLVAFKRIDAGEPVDLQTLFSGFRSNFPTLLRLGFLYLGALIASLLLSTLADGGLYLRYVVMGDTPPDAAAEDVGSAEKIFVLALLPGALGLWFAPMLAAWHQLPALQSLFFGVVAGIRNFRAFVVYIAALLGICFVAVALVAALSQLAGSSREQFAALLLVPVVVLLLATVTAGNYLSYRDIFRDNATVAAAEAP